MHLSDASERVNLDMQNTTMYSLLKERVSVSGKMEKLK
jgi:hypothetical protein